MLHILLLILKILGILLLVILGILLAVILLVLFVPVRYRGDVSFDGRPQGNVLISWLFHLIMVRVTYDGSVNAFVRVLWFRLFEQAVWTPEGTEEPEEELADGPNDRQNDRQIDRPTDRQNDRQIDRPTDRPETEEVLKNAGESVPEAGEEVVRAMEAHEHGNVVSGCMPEAWEKKEIKAEAVNGNTQKTPMIETIIETIFAAVRRVVDKITGTYRQITGGVREGQEKIDRVRAFLENEENLDTIRLLRRQAVKLLRHIFPRKIRGRVCFGFEDPYMTGKILTYISPFYGLYGKSVAVEPVFNEKVLEGELHFKGRVRAGSLVWIAVRVFLNRNFRKLLKTWRRKGK